MTKIEKKIKVLMLEDSEADANLVRLNLDEKRFDITHVISIQEATRELQTFRFDLILTDMNLPGSNGIETCKTIRQLAPDCPLIVMSGSLVDHLAAEAVGLGAQDFIPKSELTKGYLKRTIEHALTRHRLFMALQKSEKDLRVARKDAEAANTAKSDFLAKMSHEIRTPMNGIIGMTSLLKELNLGNEASEYVNTIRSSSEVLLTIINDILDLSKIESGKIELEEVPFNFRSAIEETIELYAETANSKGITLSSTVDPKVPSLMIGDVTRIRQILSNFVSNALKFTSKGEVKVTVESESQSVNELAIRITVSDTGIGIAENFAKGLFEPFCQADSSTTRKFGGTGLGLAISKQLAELMGGQVGLSSQENKGSAFWFTAKLKQSESSKYIPRAKLNQKNIVILSENRFLNRATTEQLSNRGMLCQSVDSFSRLKTLVDTKKCDLLLVDIDPELQNENWEDRLENHESLKELPFIFLVPPKTTLSNSDQIMIRKPIKQSDLYGTIASTLNLEKKVWDSQTSSISNALSKRNIKILVAEDNVVNQRVIARMLEKLGCGVDIVSNGHEAVQISSKVNYSAILMDCQMPELDGFEATKQIRKLLGPGLPIIALTACVVKGDEQRCFESGMNDYLTKPITLVRLQRTLQHWFGTEKEIQMKKNTLTSNTEFEPLNKEVLKQILEISEGENSSLLKELIDIFQEAAPPVIKNMASAIEQNEANHLMQTAHKLKGMGKNVGVIRFSALCERLETLGRTGSTQGADKIFSELSNEFSNAVKLLRDYERTI